MHIRNTSTLSCLKAFYARFNQIFINAVLGSISMEYTTIAPYGKNIKNLITGLEAFPSKSVILIVPIKFEAKAEKTKKELIGKGIGVTLLQIEGDVWEVIFEKIAELTQGKNPHQFIINTSSGDSNTQCAATSAAFVNGIKAIAVELNHVMLLPILKFSYYKMLTDKKMELLRAISDESCCSSLDELSKKAKMSMPLISYHINGNLKSEGLKDLGVVETHQHDGKISITLSTLGKLLLKGYVTHE